MSRLNKEMVAVSELDKKLPEISKKNFDAVIKRCDNYTKPILGFGSLRHYTKTVKEFLDDSAKCRQSTTLSSQEMNDILQELRETLSPLKEKAEFNPLGTIACLLKDLDKLLGMADELTSTYDSAYRRR